MQFNSIFNRLNENQKSLSSVREILRNCFESDYNDLSERTKKIFYEKYKLIFKIVLNESVNKK